MKSRRRRRIGLLGGSFNPAHDGHRHISLAAMKHLRLDAVWWLVSPQNPLKPTEGMAALPQRLAAARTVARHPRICVSDAESRMGVRYTADSIGRLRLRYPDCRFVWIMGADNLMQMHLWRCWRRIFALAPIAVINRPGYDAAVVTAVAAKVFAPRRKPRQHAAALADAAPPAWLFLPVRANAESATRIRQLSAFGADGADFSRKEIL